jgi:ribosome-associated toxin RatA of RatAB toxin-antitoxin module
MRHGLLLGLVLLLAPRAAAQTQGRPSLRAIEPGDVPSLAPAAHHGELAVIESNPDGTMRQVTLIVFVRAPAAEVRALVADVGNYLHFVPNLKQNDFRRETDGRLINTWRLELPISSFAGRDAYEMDEGTLGEIRFHSLESLASYQWRFVPVEGGSLLVQAGYTDVLHANRFVRAFVRRQPALEHGLALAAQYMLVSAVKKEAERRAATSMVGARPAGNSGSGAAALERLSMRGQVVVMRAEPNGRLAEVSAIDHVYAGEARVHQVLSDPGSYREFIAGVDRSTVLEQGAGQATYLVDMALPIVTWSTTYLMRMGPHAVDGFGVDGDLRGARYRWDLLARGPADTLVTYRANQPLSRGSVLVGKLFEVDPSLEHGLNVAFALLQLRSVRGRAEGWPTR